VGDQYGHGVQPKRTAVVACYTDPAPNATTICVDELGPVTPRSYPPAPGWSPDGHRIKQLLEYSRGPEKVWVYGALRVRDGQALTLTAPSRNTAGYLRLLQAVAAANPVGQLNIITDNLTSHKSPPIQEWLAANPRAPQVFIAVGACWLNLQEGWWRLLRRDAFAGQSFIDDDEITEAVRLATGQLNVRAQPWVWGRPPKPHRTFRRHFVYSI
jgi:DDE superfamily endonuclease